MGEDTVRALMKSLMDDWANMMNDADGFEKNWAKYYDDGVVVVRPSGNLASKETFAAMASGGDVKHEGSELLKIEHVKVFAGGNAAVVVVRSHEKFSYKGTPNDDVAVYTFTLERSGEGWKIVACARSSGQKPS
eukprot:Hpha_TRINITY_DN8478_c0_g2::TRINITY_DN8478_c0_g2_i2::g.34809::m.34809